MIYSFGTCLLMRLWTGLLLLMVAALIGSIVASATGQLGSALIAIILMGAVFIGSIMALVGACRLFIAFFRIFVWR